MEGTFKGPQVQFPCDEQVHLQQSQTTRIVPSAPKHAANAVLPLTTAEASPAHYGLSIPSVPAPGLSVPLYTLFTFPVKAASRRHTGKAAGRQSRGRAVPACCRRCRGLSRSCRCTLSLGTWGWGERSSPRHPPPTPSPRALQSRLPPETEKGAQVQTWDAAYASTASVLNSNSKFQYSLQSTVTRR